MGTMIAISCGLFGVASAIAAYAWNQRKKRKKAEKDLENEKRIRNLAESSNESLVQLVAETQELEEIGKEDLEIVKKATGEAKHQAVCDLLDRHYGG